MAEQKTKIRKDIQGLRAVAVLLVLVFHFWPNRLTGGYVGVDVFFVISGFLITLHLLQKPPKSYKMLLDFWGKRIRRLLPVATLVLLTTLVAGYFLLPTTRVETMAKESIAASMYGENWMLASTATDYLASEDAKSPVQHYWSLSVEEQFYIAWPLIILASAAIAYKRKTSLLNVAAWAIGFLLIGSLIWSIYWTNENSAHAYFMTFTRVWELAAGGLAAAVSLRLAIKKHWAAAMAWIGLIMIGISALVLNSKTLFPGYIAIIPVLGAVFVILANTDDVKWSPRKLLKLPVVQMLGDTSYSIYLWHWPAVVIATAVLGGVLTLWQKLIIIAGVIGISYLSKRYIEDVGRTAPFFSRHLVRAYGLAVIGVVTISSVSGLAIWQVQAAQNANMALAAKITQKNSEMCVGARAVKSGCKPQTEEVILSPDFAKSDKPDVYDDDCWSNRPFSRHKVCTYGNQKSDTKIALIGNSHAGHWHPILDQLINEQYWRLDTYLVSECYTVSLPLEFDNDTLTNNCQTWNKWALAEISKGDYDVVVMSNRTYAKPIGISESSRLQVTEEAYGVTIDKLLKSGVNIVVIRDVPAMSQNVPDCIALNDDIKDCTTPRKTALPADPLYNAAREIDGKRVRTADVSDVFCDNTICYPVVGGLITYFDHGHINKTFALTLYDYVAPVVVNSVRDSS